MFPRLAPLRRRLAQHPGNVTCPVCPPFPGQAEGWMRPERDGGPRLPGPRGGALFMAGTQNASPAANLAGLRLHAATLHRLPSRVCCPQLPEGGGVGWGGGGGMGWGGGWRGAVPAVCLLEPLTETLTVRCRGRGWKLL